MKWLTSRQMQVLVVLVLALAYWWTVERAETPDPNPPVVGAGMEYRRSAFGPSWADVDGNGCDTRNDMLSRDLDLVTYSRTDRCVVTSGTLSDPYTARTIRFDRTKDASRVQIDHVVPLSYAWRNGAYSWDPQTRRQFANDPDNLLAVDGPTNMAKGDKGPAQWLPPNTNYRCAYLSQFSRVVLKYNLDIPEPDRSTLNSCR